MSGLLQRLFLGALLVCGLLVVAVVVVSVLKGPVERGPAAVPNPDFDPPVVAETLGVRRVFAGGAPEQLLIDTVFPDTPVRLVWLQERTAEPIGGEGGQVVVLDAAGGIVSYSDRLLPRALGTAGTGASLIDVVPAPGGMIRAVTAANELLRIDAAGRVASRDTLTVFSRVDLVGGPQGQLWAVRSPAGVGATDDPRGGPLAARIDVPGGIVTPFGTALDVGEGAIHLLNAGALVVTADRVFYAPHTRDEVVGFDLDADTIWVTVRGDRGVELELSIVSDTGEIPLSYERYNLGLTMGPDGRLYSLRELPPDHGVDRRIDVYDPATGDLLRSGTFASGRSTSIALDRDGRVYLLDEVRLLTGLTASARRPFPGFDLELLAGGRIDESVLAGRVSVVNVWASWCGPCREELPLLETFARSVVDPEFQLVTFNEDVSSAAAGLFLNELNLDLAVALGRGRLKQQFGYWGLPHTVLVDREGRVVYSWTGFGRAQQMQQLRAMVRAELDR